MFIKKRKQKFIDLKLKSSIIPINYELVYENLYSYCPYLNNVGKESNNTSECKDVISKDILYETRLNKIQTAISKIKDEQYYLQMEIILAAHLLTQTDECISNFIQKICSIIIYLNLNKTIMKSFNSKMLILLDLFKYIEEKK